MVPAAVTEDGFTVTFRSVVMPGVRACGPGDNGFFVSCWKLRTRFPFASLVPFTVGRPVVAVAVLITLPFASSLVLWPGTLFTLMIGLALIEASVSILTVMDVRDEAFAAVLNVRLSPPLVVPATVTD